MREQSPELRSLFFRAEQIDVRLGPHLEIVREPFEDGPFDAALLECVGDFQIGGLNAPDAFGVIGDIAVDAFADPLRQYVAMPRESESHVRAIGEAEKRVPIGVIECAQRLRVGLVEAKGADEGPQVHVAQAFVPTPKPGTRSHECERGKQECLRHVCATSDGSEFQTQAELQTPRLAAGKNVAEERPKIRILAGDAPVGMIQNVEPFGAEFEHR